MTVASRSTRLLALLLAFVLGVGAAAGLAACGSSGSSTALIPATDADQLKGDLDDVAAAVDGQDCRRADTALSQLDRDLGQLPAGTSKRLERKLRTGYDRLRRQAAKECRPQTTTTQTIPTTTVATTTTDTTVTTTTTPTTATTTTPSTTPTTPATTPTAAPDTGGVTTP